MAIKDYKNIERINLELDETAQLIDASQLKIFKTSVKNVSDFGLSKNDVVEFRLYDLSNNLLELVDGNTVKYITNTELSKYLKSGLDENTGEKIYEIDVEKLVYESGYSNGEFRTTLNFVKNYIGSNNETTKLWIHEISPSRTEIRVLPVIGSDESINKHMMDRYNSFLKNEEELRASYKEILKTIDGIENNVTEIIDSYFISQFGNEYIDVLNKDFIFGGLSGYDNFKRKVYKDFRQSIIHQLNGKQFELGVSNYGQLISGGMDMDEFISNDEIRMIIENRLMDSIEYNFKNINLREYSVRQKLEEGQIVKAGLIDRTNVGYDTITTTETKPDTTGVASGNVTTTTSGNGGDGNSNYSDDSNNYGTDNGFTPPEDEQKDFYSGNDERDTFYSDNAEEFANNYNDTDYETQDTNNDGTINYDDTIIEGFGTNPPSDYTYEPIGRAGYYEGEEQRLATTGETYVWDSNDGMWVLI